MDPNDVSAASPWWLGIAGTIIAALTATIAKLWTVIVSQRADAEARDAARDAAIDAVNSEHKRDLRHTIGWWSQQPPAPVFLPPRRDDRSAVAPPPIAPVVVPPRPRAPRRPKPP